MKTLSKIGSPKPVSYTHLFSKDGDQPYFMEDTIHMGWNGWLAFDKVVNPFVTKAEKAPTYHLNDRFFSKDWAQYKGTPDEFK